MKQEQRIDRLVSRIQELNDIVARYPGFAEGLQGRGQENTLLTPTAVRDGANDMAQEGRSLRVGIIGRVKAGKSSLLNALLFEGKNILPKAATPMTASLTVLGYADQPRAEVEFFTQEDIGEMRKLAQDYDEKFERLVQEKLQKPQAKPVGFSTRPAAPLSSPDPERIKASVRRELDADPQLGGAKDLYERIQKAGGLPAEARIGEPRHIKAKNIDDLRGQLPDYVGAEGKFTPFTKCLSLFLPLAALQGMEVVDTPGINDPIPSREKRTYEALHRCDVVFIVSPSGQFLNAQDLSLMDRISDKDGVGEVFLVASQIDGQLFGSERQKYGGHLPSVLQGLQQTLAQQAHQTLAAKLSSNPGLDTLKQQLNERLVVTSAVAHTLSTQEENSWDENARHVRQMLGKLYPSDFADIQTAQPRLNAMAGMAQTVALLDKVRASKQSITGQKLDLFVEAQSKLLAQRLEQAPKIVGESRSKVETADGDLLEAQLKSIQGVRTKGSRVVNTAVSEVAQNAAIGLTERMYAEIHKLFTELKSTAERAKGTATSSYTVEKDGLVAGAARFFGLGGTESRTETVSTIKAGALRNALQEIHTTLSGRLTSVVGSARKQLHQELQRHILGSLREYEVVHDRDIDTSLLAQSCTQATAHLRDFDDPVLAPLPDALLQSGTLKDNAADRFASAAMEYAGVLRKSAEKSAKKISNDFEDRLKSAEVGTALFEHYEDHIKELKAQIKDRAQTLQRYDNLLSELRELQRNV